LELSLEDRNLGLQVDGRRCAVEAADVVADGINVTVTFRTTLGAIRGDVLPKLERIWGGFREHEVADVRVRDGYPSGGTVKILGIVPPEVEGDEVLVKVRAITQIFNGSKLFLAPGLQGCVPIAWLRKKKAD